MEGSSDRVLIRGSVSFRPGGSRRSSGAEDDERFCGAVEGNQRVWFPRGELRRVSGSKCAVSRADEQPRNPIEEV